MDVIEAMRNLRDWEGYIGEHGPQCETRQCDCGERFEIENLHDETDMCEECARNQETDDE